MPNVEDVLKQTRFTIARLKELGSGIKVARVLGDRVLVKTVIPRTELDEVEKRGTLYIPEKIKEENTPLPTTGVVLAVGDDVSHGVKEGDMVLFPKLAGLDFTVSEQNLRILETRTILAILADTDNSVVEVK